MCRREIPRCEKCVEGHEIKKRYVLIVGVLMGLGIGNVPCERGRMMFPGLE